MTTSFNRFCCAPFWGRQLSQLSRDKNNFRSLSSLFSNSPALVGQYIAPDTNLKIMIFEPKQDEDIWKEYLCRLDKAYKRHGNEVERNDDPSKTALLALAVERKGEKDYMVGGIRMEGPFAKVTDIPAIKAMNGIDGTDRIIDHINELCFTESSSVVMEARGMWTNRKGVSRALARAGPHLKWMLDADHVMGLTSLHSKKLYQEIGFSDVNLPKGGVSTFAYPDERYETCPIVITPQYMDILDAHTRQLMRYEQRVLVPTKDRFLQQKQSKIFDKKTATCENDNKIKDLYTPEILVEDDVRVQKLRETPGIMVVDHVPSMMKELTDGILPKVTDPLLLDEPTHWIYLPWRRALLRVLGPKGYKLLRTDRNRYKMTPDEIHQLALRSVGVIGMSVGHSCAVGLAQEALCGHLNLADFDILELPNLNRIPTSIIELGSNKTTMTARRIAEIDPYMTVNIYKDGVTEENIEDFFKHMDCVVEECDSLDVKVLTRLEAAKQRTPVIMETSDRGLLDIERYDLDPSRAPFHGLAGASLNPQTLKGLSTKEKGPFVLAILEFEKISPRLAASLMEIGKSISSWPQLARDVALGGALVSSAVHKLFLDPASLPSGRSRTDLSDALDRLEDPLASEQQQNHFCPDAVSAQRNPIMMRREKEKISSVEDYAA